MEYAIYPFQYIRISQRHDEGNHLGHWSPSTNYSDKPWDEAEKDSGRQYFCPQNDFKIVQILGLGVSTPTNSVRLESVNKLKIPYQEKPIKLELTLTHINEDTLKKLKVGQIIHKNEKVIYEGKDGATAYHFHCTANIGKYYGMFTNTNKKSVFCYEKSLTPNEAFYIDPNFNIIISSNGYKFKSIPTNTFQYRVYVEGDGWTKWVSSGICGTVGKSKVIRAIEFKSNKEILAKAHINNIGWKDYGKVNDGKQVGESSHQLECLQLKGDFKYRVHIANFGWSNYTKADGIATLGSVGLGWGIEAIEIG